VDQKAGCAQNISDKIADEDFVFDHQNRNRGGASYHVSLPTSAVSPSGRRKWLAALQKFAAFMVSKGLTTAAEEGPLLTPSALP
jgi:hypothetical protein